MASSTDNTVIVNLTLKKEQEEAVNALLDGKDVLAVMPTGFGKSRIFQTYTIIKNRDNNAVVLVITPLQSIIKDQLQAVNDVGILASDLSSLNKYDIEPSQAHD